MNLTDQEKLDLIVAGIALVKTQNPGNPFIQLPVNSLTRLNEIDPNEIKAILESLESKDGILKVGAFNFPKTDKKAHYSTVLLSDDIYIDLEILPAFDNWYSAYLLAKGRRLSDLNDSHIQNIYHLVLDIASELQISQSPVISVLKESPKRFELLNEFEAITTSLQDKKYRVDSIEFLNNLDIISRPILTLPGNIDTNNDLIEFRVNIVKFEQFKKEIEKIYLARLDKKRLPLKPKDNNQYVPENNIKASKKDPVQSAFEDATIRLLKNISNKPTATETMNLDEKPLYWVTFPASNDILVNDLVVLAKPNLDKENGNIFGYLIDHPKKTIPKKEIEDHIGKTIGKDFHKVVENLGFKGDFKKAFFKISKDAIYFRNPVTKSDLDQLNIPALRISK